MLLFRKPGHILENQVIFFFNVSGQGSSQITELDAAFTSSDPNPIFINCIVNHHPLEGTNFPCEFWLHPPDLDCILCARPI